MHDNQRGIRRAAEHLCILGHDRINYVAGPEASWSDGVRWRALREAAHELGAGCAASIRTTPHRAHRDAAARRIADERATAVLAYNDPLAIGVIKGLKQAGDRRPADISVIGIDNIMFDELVEPALTTVAAPMYRMGFIGIGNCSPSRRGEDERRDRWSCR